MSSYQVPVKRNNEFSTIFCFAFKVDIAKVLNDVVIALEESEVPLLFRYRLSLNKTGLDLEDAFTS